MPGTHDSRRECNNTRIQEASSRASSRSSTHPWSALFVRILLATFPAAFHMKRKEKSLHVGGFRKLIHSVGRFSLDFSYLMCLR